MIKVSQVVVYFFISRINSKRRKRKHILRLDYLYILSMGSTFKIVNNKETILNFSYESLNFNTYLLALMLTDHDYSI